MPILYLSRHELVTLSTLGVVKLGQLSPLKYDYIAYVAEKDMKNKEFTIESLILNGLLVREGKKLRLPIEMETPFLMMNDPDEVLMCQTFGGGIYGKVHFCYRDPYWLQYSEGSTVSPECVAYPMGGGMLNTWFVEEFLGGHTFSKDPQPSCEVHLSPDEGFLMHAFQDIYAERVGRLGPLNRQQQRISMEDLENSAIKQKNYGLLVSRLFPESLKQGFLKNTGITFKVITNLIGKGLLVEDNNGYRFCGLALLIFNPGRVHKGMLVNKKNREHSALSLCFVYDCGSAIVDYSPSAGGLKYAYYNDDVGKEQLWGKLMSNLYNQLAEGQSL